MTSHPTVAVVLPSGIESERFTVRVVTNEENLSCVKWSIPLVDLNCMHKKWI